MNLKKTEIKCAYCDSVWDYSKYDKCPFCGAAPELNEVDKAHHRELEQIQQKAEAEAVKNPGKALTNWVASKMKLWIIIMLCLTIVPIIFLCIMSSVPSKKPTVDLQVVDEVKTVTHPVGEEFNVTDYMSVNVLDPNALLLTESSVSSFIPEDYALLLIRTSAKGDGSYYGLRGIKDKEYVKCFGVPYVIADNVAYEPIMQSHLNDFSITEPELRNIITINPNYSLTLASGYLCYIVPNDISSCTINFEEVHYTNTIRFLDCVHTVELTVEEVE